MGLFRIIYVSDAVGAAGEGLMPLIDIIGVSDRNNRRDHITGVLVRHDHRFIQAVEGARVDLDRLMARLAADRRHASIRILQDAPVEARAFDGWAMALIEPTDRLKAWLDAESLGGPDAGPRAQALLVEASRPS